MDKDDNNKIKFDFIKSNAYRVIHADGAYGGLSPRLGIFMALYSERPPIPQSVTHEFSGSGLGQELRELRITRDAVVREVEVGVYLDVEVAKVVIAWLQEKVRQVGEIQAGAPNIGVTEEKPQ